MSNTVIHIDAKKNRFSSIKDIIAYYDLIWLFVRKFYVLKYKQTILGPLWLILNPLFTILMNSFIFGTVAKLTPEGVPQLLFYTCGNTIWSIFAGNVSVNANTFLFNNHLFSKVYFPRIIIPISNLIINFLNFLIQFLLFIGMMVIFSFKGSFSFNFTPQIFMVSVIIIQLSCFGLGIGLILSAMTIKYRDISFIIGLIIQLASYASPIVYSLSDVPHNITNWYMLNPITPAVCYFKYIFLNIDYVEPNYFMLSLSVSFLTMIFGILVFNIVEKNSVDTI